MTKGKQGEIRCLMSEAAGALLRCPHGHLRRRPWIAGSSAKRESASSPAVRDRARQACVPMPPPPLLLTTEWLPDRARRCTRRPGFGWRWLVGIVHVNRCEARVVSLKR